MRNIIMESENEIRNVFKEIDDTAFFYSEKVLNAFHKYHFIQYPRKLQVFCE